MATNLFTYPPTKKQHIENVRTLILECSGLEPEWIVFIKNDSELYKSLLDAVSELVKYYTDSRAKVMPAEPTEILAALKYCKPADVKVVILGHDPIRESDLATGLAFSYPRGKTESNVSETGKGRSVRIVHNALKAAEIKPGKSLNHEHWARRGVLLLNACLTIDPGNPFFEKSDGSGDKENPHFEYWKNFTCRLLKNLLDQNRNNAGPPIFVLCWGTQARDVRDYLEPYLQQGDTVVEYDGNHSELLQQQLGPVVIASGHHPTHPRTDDRRRKNNFLTQATNQFTAIKSKYSTLFDQDTGTLVEQVAGLQISETNDSTN